MTPSITNPNQVQLINYDSKDPTKSVVWATLRTQRGPFQTNYHFSTESLGLPPCGDNSKTVSLSSNCLEYSGVASCASEIRLTLCLLKPTNKFLPPTSAARLVIYVPVEGRVAAKKFEFGDMLGCEGSRFTSPGDYACTPCASKSTSLLNAKYPNQNGKDTGRNLFSYPKMQFVFSRAVSQECEILV